MGVVIHRRLLEDNETVLSVSAEEALGGPGAFEDVMNKVNNLRPDLARGMYTYTEQEFPNKEVHIAMKLYVN